MTDSVMISNATEIDFWKRPISSSLEKIKIFYKEEQIKFI